MLWIHNINRKENPSERKQPFLQFGWERRRRRKERMHFTLLTFKRGKGQKGKGGILTANNPRRPTNRHPLSLFRRFPRFSFYSFDIQFPSIFLRRSARFTVTSGWVKSSGSRNYLVRVLLLFWCFVLIK